MDDMPDWFRVLAPKVAGYLAASIIGFLGSYSIHVSHEAEIAVTTLLMLIMGGTYGIVKAWVAAHTNPAGVNSPKMAGEIHAELKAKDQNG